MPATPSVAMAQWVSKAPISPISGRVPRWAPASWKTTRSNSVVGCGIRSVKPGNKMAKAYRDNKITLSDEEQVALVAYLESLK